MQRIIRRGIYLSGIAVALILPFIVTSNYMLGILNLGLIMVVATLGLNISKGYLGLFNAAHAGIWGLGAYAAALLATKLGWPFALTIIAATLAGSIGGLFLGVVALKLKGIYFAILTIGFTLMVQLSANNWDAFTNGPNGIGSIPLPDFGFFKVTNKQQLYFVLLASTALSIWFCVRVSRNKYGRAMRAIQSHEAATELMGVNTYYDKTLGLILSSGLCGFSGALLAHAYGFIAPVQFGFDQAVLFIVSLVTGGLGSIPGAILGALFFTFLPEFMRPLRFWSTTIYGVLVAVAILFFPEGLVSLARRIPFINWLNSPVNNEKGKEADTGSSLISIPILKEAARASTKPVLQVEDMGIRFGGLQALMDVSMELLPGKVHALIGPNGAGKTTLVNCITGAYKPDHGSILLSGKSILGLKPYQISRLGISRTFQNLALWNELSVTDNLLVAKRGTQTKGFWPVILGTKDARLEDATARNEAKDFLNAIGLWPERDRKIGTLPFGHQKMLEIMRALMTNPKILFLDEPAAGLTLPEMLQLKQLIGSIKNHGVAVLLIEHNVQLVMDIADTITVLDYGKKIASGNPQSVRNNPEVIKAYLGAEDLTSLKREVKSHV